MSNKISIGWPTLGLSDTVDTCSGFTVTLNNAQPTVSDFSNFPGMYLAQDVFGNWVLCTDIVEGTNAPEILDGNNVTHVAKPWVLVPASGNEYVGGHPHYVPKPPTK